MNKILIFTLLLLSFLPSFSFAQELHQEYRDTFRAEVIDVVSQEEKLIPGTDTYTTVQKIRVEILEGEKEGEKIFIENDFLVLKEGQKFFLDYLETFEGEELYTVRDVDRRGAIIILVLIFSAIVLFFGKMQGLKSLMSLLGSFLVIIYILLPLLIKGYNPIFVSVTIGALILFVAIFFTHGFNMRSTVAFLGTSISILITGVFAYFAIDLLSLSGFFSDETVYLNFSTEGHLDFKGLLLGGIIIGVLGVLDDIAITQVAAVSEINKVADNISKKDLYQRGLNIGKEHVSALVNTIVLAYAGVSLPLLLWFSESEAGIGKIVNNEVFATEIARTIVGSIGLILTVPITTFLAVLFIDKYKNLKGGHTHHHTH